MAEFGAEISGRKPKYGLEWYRKFDQKGVGILSKGGWKWYKKFSARNGISKKRG